jgi:hypothetical protein
MADGGLYKDIRHTASRDFKAVDGGLNGEVFPPWMPEALKARLTTGGNQLW